MERSVSFAMALLCALALMVSCQKAPELTLTGPSSIELSADGGSGSFTFTANRDWTVSCSDSWLSVSPSSGTASDGPVSVTVRCNANTTYEDRSATVTVRMEELSRTVTVRQPANLGIIVATQSYDLAADARSLVVEVQANVQYNVEVTADWIKQTSTKALASKALTFDVKENTSFDKREGMIVIRSQQASVSDQVITVRQAQKDALIVSNSVYDVAYGGGEVEFKVDANVSFDVKTDAEWIHYVSTKALTTSTVTLKIDANPTSSVRSGRVEVSQQGGSLTHNIVINQDARIAVSSVELDNEYLLLLEGDTEKLVATVKPDNATDKTVTWKSSNTAVATVDNTGNVKAVSVGDATITATAGGVSANCPVTVQKIPVGAVDLGVVMTREDGSRYRLFWAKCNIGAKDAWGFGGYFAWGETETKSEYSWATYKFRVSGDSTDNLVFSKYNTRATAGQVDNKVVLEPVDDVAHVAWGGKWRMPTVEEWGALSEQCTWVWTTHDGVNGYEVKSNVPGNTNSIILPGGGTKGGLYGQSGYYWSSSLYNPASWSYPFNAWDLVFGSEKIFAGVRGSTDPRYAGLSVRAVSE